MQCSTEAWLLWFLWIGGGVGLGRNSGPLLSDQYLKDFPALVYRFGGRWRQCRAATSMTGCQDQFNSHNGRKGHLTSVIFSNMLQSCCWLALLKHFPCEKHCAVWMLSLCRGCWMFHIAWKYLFRFIVLIFSTKLLLMTLSKREQHYRTVEWAANLFDSNMFCWTLDSLSSKTNAHFLFLVNNQPNHSLLTWLTN